MSDVKSKILSVIGKPVLGSLATIDDEGNPWARYVMISSDEDLHIRLATFKGSRKTAQIGKNPQVHIVTGVTSLEAAQHYVQIQGKARVTDDPAVKKANWSDGLKTYFQGPDDPSYVVIEIAPYRIEYQTMGSGDPEVWER